MALLFMDGFDAGDTLLKWRCTTANITPTVGGRFGTGRYVDVYNGGIYQDFTSGYNKIFVGVALGCVTLDTTIRACIGIYGDSQITQHLTVGIASNAIQLRRGGTTGTILGSYTSIFANNAFYYIEVSATIADSGGTCQVRCNGQLVIDYTGDTKNAGTNTTIDGIGVFANGTTHPIVDDLYICDDSGAAPYNSFLGDTRVQTLVPNGAGSSTQFTPSSGANYTTVDELPYSTADYVASATSGHRDTYALSDIGTVNTVYGVQNNVIVRKTDSSSISIKPALKSSSTVAYGSTVVLGTSDMVVKDTRSLDPNTSTAWTQTSINALESGFEVV